MNQIACTQKEASEMLGVSPSTITTYVKDGRIKATKVGTRTLIHISSLYRLIDEDEPIELNVSEEYYSLFENMTVEDKRRELNKLLDLSMKGGTSTNE